MNAEKREHSDGNEEGEVKRVCVRDNDLNKVEQKDSKKEDVLEYDANSVVSFHEVTILDEEDGNQHLLQVCPSFNPGMSHQVFENEKVVGVKDPHVDVYFNPSTCDMCVITKCEGGIEDRKKLTKTVRKWIADDSNTNRTVFMKRIADSERDFKPIGTVISEYSVNDSPFTLYMNSLTSPAAVKLFKNIQSLAYWFIDGASEIVIVPDSPHRWIMLTLYTTIENHYVLVGYCLLYIFTNPFHHPRQSLRLCQILILPPYQKQGHSFRIFDAIYSSILHTPPSRLLPESYDDALDGCQGLNLEKECSFYMYTIEDPCEEFTFVRDVYDCKLLMKQECMKEYMNGEVRMLTEEVKEEIRRTVGIIPEQLQKCYNIILHHIVNKENIKDYQLFMKRQIAKKYRNELELIRERDVFKATVGIYYDSTEEYYENVCKVVFK